MLLVGRKGGMVNSIQVDAKNVTKAFISIQSVLQRTLLRHTARVTMIRGRPSNGVRPDRRSRILARQVFGTTGSVSVGLVSRIVIYSNGCCDFTSRKLVWEGEVALWLVQVDNYTGRVSR